MTSFLILILLASPVGKPLFYWGARPPVISNDESPTGAAKGEVAEVHAALDKTDLILRFTFHSAVHDLLYLPTGIPVSGRLRALLYLDVDDDRMTGMDAGGLDLRTGADLRLEVGSLTIGEDSEEHRVATALVITTVSSLSRDGQQRVLWRGDPIGAPRNIGIYGDSIDIRLPQAQIKVEPKVRLILWGEQAKVGRLRP